MRRSGLEKERGPCRRCSPSGPCSPGPPNRAWAAPSNPANFSSRESDHPGVCFPTFIVASGYGCAPPEVPCFPDCSWNCHLDETVIWTACTLGG